MLLEYSKLIFDLLKTKQYPVIKNYVVLDIFYKIIKPKNPGKRFFSRCPEVLFEQENDPSKIIYLCDEGKYIIVHKEDPKDIDLKSLPVECLRIKIYQGYINKILQTNFKFFEEEIYTLLTHLNYDIPKIREILNLSYTQSTRFIPDHIRLWVSNAIAMPMDCGCSKMIYFGVVHETIDTRMIRGKLSACTANTKILSCNNDQGIKDDNLIQELSRNLLDYDLYNIHYIPEHQAYIPLAYNPLENPIIQ